MDLDASLELAQLAVFVLLGAAAVRVWFRRNTRPSRYLASAFGLLSAVLIISRFTGDSTGATAEFATDLAVAGLAGFPWLLAAFAWSFEARLPRWLRVTGIAVGALAVWIVLMPPLPESGEPRSGGDVAFLTTFMAVWAGLSIAAAIRLWSAGGSRRLVRARMRLMSTGAVTLTVTLMLLVAGFVSADLRVATTLLSMLSAILFGAGFAPPAPLRLWWRRHTASQWEQTQVALIAAVTPTDVARAVTPIAADLLGGAVAVVASDGSVLAEDGLGDEAALMLAERLASGAPLPGDDEALRVNESWLVVRRTPYTPLFGVEERDMLASLSLQLRLALERAELFVEHREAMRAAEQSKEEFETMLVGLSHDLRSPSVAIVGFAGLLRQTDDARERDEMLDDIETSARYVGRLVDALLELSGVGRTQLDVEPVELEATARAVASRVAVSHPGITVDIRPGLPVVLMNPARAEQIVDNLLGNAAKHGGRDDLTVTIEAKYHPRGVRLLVTDNGRGIHVDDRDSIFALFKRARGASTDGNGVGLGLVRRIVEVYGGTIDVTDRREGAQLVIDLPDDVLFVERAPAESDAGGSVRSPVR